MTVVTLPSGLEVMLKDSNAGAWYGSVCDGCLFFPCHDALMALRLTADLRLQFCLLRQDNTIEPAQLVHDEDQLGIVIRDALEPCPLVILVYISSQGCVYKCQFCYELTYQRKYSAMAADGLVAGIDDLARRFGLNGIKFYDADWFVNLKRAAAFCEGVIEGGLDIKWAASINPNDILKARRAGIPLLKLVAASGGSRLLMGVESGNDRVLREVVKKEVTRAQILDVTKEIVDPGCWTSS